MTQVERPRLNVRRLGAVYGIDVIDHASWMAGQPVIMPNDYDGQTRQKGRARENQHRDDKPWSDLIVGSPRVLWEGMCTDDELDDVERRFIKQGVDGVRPRLNWKLNEDNRKQIPIPRQVEQRWERDDRAGRARWVPLDQRQCSSLLEWDPVSPRFGPDLPVRRLSAPRSWSAGTRKVCLWSSAWILLAAGTWGAFPHYGLSATWKVKLLSVCVAPTVLLLWGRRRRPDTCRLWRRRRAALSRWWASLRRWRAKLRRWLR